jgi:hypothetical protein
MCGGSGSLEVCLGSLSVFCVVGARVLRQPSMHALLSTPPPRAWNRPVSFSHASCCVGDDGGREQQLHETSGGSWSWCLRPLRFPPLRSPPMRVGVHPYHNTIQSVRVEDVVVERRHLPHHVGCSRLDFAPPPTKGVPLPLPTCFYVRAPLPSAGTIRRPRSCWLRREAA